jgi:hypothetical protein
MGCSPIGFPYMFCPECRAIGVYVHCHSGWRFHFSPASTEMAERSSRYESTAGFCAGAPHRRRRLHRLHPPSRQRLRPKQNRLLRKRRLRGKRVRLQAQCPQGARPRKRPTHPRRAEATARCGLTPRHVFTTGKARVFTARRGKANS